jgi:hypothetical protein
MTDPNIVAGAVATVTELDKDEAWLRGWLKEQPGRLGLGAVEVTDDTPDDEPFAATDDERCFSVDVWLGGAEPSRGFSVLDGWARNRVRHPDKTHVAVLVTESIPDRYQTTLEALAEHLPLVVVELQVWRGEKEAIIVPFVAVASHEVDLSQTAAAKAADAVARSRAAVSEPVEAESPTDGEDEDGDPAAEPVTDEADHDDASDAAFDKDDTGVGNPWGLPDDEGETSDSENGHRLLSKVS